MWASTPVSCLTHSWGRINPVRHAPSLLVELSLASFSAVPSLQDEQPSSHRDFGGKRVTGAPCYPTAAPLPLALHGVPHSAWLTMSYPIHDLGSVRDSPVVARNGAEYITNIKSFSFQLQYINFAHTNIKSLPFQFYQLCPNLHKKFVFSIISTLLTLT